MIRILATMALATVPALSPMPAPRTAPPGAVVMRLLPARVDAAVGDSIALQLEFENRARAPVRLWLAEPGHADGWDLRLRVRRPTGDTLALRPAVYDQAIYYRASEAVVTLAPGARRTVRVTLMAEDDRRGPDYTSWEVFTPALERQLEATGTWVPDAELRDHCFDREGRYAIEATLDLTEYSAISWGAAHDSTGGAGLPPPVRERLRAGPAFVVLHRARASR